ncbi:hypothetical protein GGC47_004039 [Bosea sp. OAE752]|jgi:hypothetical protein
MMGERTVAQEALFYEFNLERHVPASRCSGPMARETRPSDASNPTGGQFSLHRTPQTPHIFDIGGASDQVGALRLRFTR